MEIVAMLVDMKNIIVDMLSFTWPMVVISMVIAISLRLVYIFTNKEKFILYKELLKLFFIIYILCLFQVVTYQDVSYGGMNFIPFKEIFRYNIGSYMFYKNILGNMLLFLPFGFFVGYFLKTKNNYLIIILSLITSLSIEITQGIIGRVFDVDDIFLNVLGAFIGFLIYKYGTIIKDKLPDKFKKEWILNVLTIILVVLAVRFMML